MEFKLLKFHRKVWLSWFVCPYSAFSITLFCYDILRNDSPNSTGLPKKLDRMVTGTWQKRTYYERLFLDVLFSYALHTETKQTLTSASFAFAEWVCRWDLLFFFSRFVLFCQTASGFVTFFERVERRFGETHLRCCIMQNECLKRKVFLRKPFLKRSLMLIVELYNTQHLRSIHVPSRRWLNPNVMPGHEAIKCGRSEYDQLHAQRFVIASIVPSVLQAWRTNKDKNSPFVTASRFRSQNTKLIECYFLRRWVSSSYARVVRIYSWGRLCKALMDQRLPFELRCGDSWFLFSAIASMVSQYRWLN